MSGALFLLAAGTATAPGFRTIWTFIAYKIDHHREIERDKPRLGVVSVGLGHFGTYAAHGQKSLELRG